MKQPPITTKLYLENERGETVRIETELICPECQQRCVVTKQGVECTNFMYCDYVYFSEGLKEENKDIIPKLQSYLFPDGETRNVLDMWIGRYGK
jgi:hypothetical protein